MVKVSEGISGKNILLEPLTALCCGRILRVGEEISICTVTSKNRVLINSESGGHNVKYSSYRRCTRTENLEKLKR